MPDLTSSTMTWKCEHCHVIHEVNVEAAFDAGYLHCDYCGAEHRIASVKSANFQPSVDASELN